MFKITLIALIYAAVATAAEVCNTPSYVPCPPNSGSGSGGGGGGGGGGVPAVYQGSGFVIPSPVGSGSVQGAAINPIQGSSGDDGEEKRKRGSIYDLTFGATLQKRDSGLCCQPSPIKCMTATDPTNGDVIPYCYNPSTTRCYFLGGDVYFVNNETYISADGTVANFATGVVTYPNGTTETFAVNTTTTSTSSTAGGASATSTAATAPTSTPKGNEAVGWMAGHGTATMALLVALVAAL